MLTVLNLFGYSQFSTYLDAHSSQLIWMLTVLKLIECSQFSIYLNAHSSQFIWMLTVLNLFGCSQFSTYLDAHSSLLIWMLWVFNLFKLAPDPFTRVNHLPRKVSTGFDALVKSFCFLWDLCKTASSVCSRFCLSVFEPRLRSLQKCIFIPFTILSKCFWTKNEIFAKLRFLSFHDFV